MDRPVFPATAYTGDDPIWTAFAELYRPHNSDHKPGTKAMDLIVLNQTPSYTEPRMTTEFLECRYVSGEDPLDGWMSESERRRRRKVEGLEETDGEGLTDEQILEELAIASFMVPEILHDDDYEWGELYDATPGIPFHTTQGERDLREQISILHFRSEHDTHNGSREAISEEDIRRGEWVLVSAEGTYDREVGVFGRENEEWAECQELSYFAEYDQCTDEQFFIVDNRGRPALHNAERHEQRCALNALWNHPELDSRVNSRITWVDGRRTRFQEVEEKSNVLDQCGIHGVEISLIATGDNFAVGICRYGGVFVPNEYKSVVVGHDGTFTGRLTISTEGAKYPLRLAEINSINCC